MAQEFEFLTGWLWKLLSSWLAWGALVSVCYSGATGTGTTVFQILICAVERMCSVCTVIVCLSDCTGSHHIPVFTWKCFLSTVKTDWVLWLWALWLKLTLHLPEGPFPVTSSSLCPAGWEPVYSSFIFVFLSNFLRFVWDRFSLCSPGRPQLFHHPASASRGLGLQGFTAIPSFCLALLY